MKMFESLQNIRTQSTEESLVEDVIDVDDIKGHPRTLSDEEDFRKNLLKKIE